MREMEDATLTNERRADLSQAFPEIAELPGDPYNSRFCTSSVQAPNVSDPIRNYLRLALPRRLTYTKAEVDERMDAYLDHQPPQRVSPIVDKIARFIIAFIGGAALLVPVLIMSFHATVARKLITLSVAVFLFAVVTAVGFRATNSETLISTATYAAVLVVFVGTSDS